MIEKIASSLPLQGTQGRTPEITDIIPQGKGFADELAAITKSQGPELQTNEFPEDKENGCGNDDEKNSTSSTPLVSS